VVKARTKKWHFNTSTWASAKGEEREEDGMPAFNEIMGLFVSWVVRRPHYHLLLLKAGCDNVLWKNEKSFAYVRKMLLRDVKASSTF
jgi:hypothetical protein